MFLRLNNNFIEIFKKHGRSHQWKNVAYSKAYTKDEKFVRVRRSIVVDFHINWLQLSRAALSFFGRESTTTGSFP